MFFSFLKAGSEKVGARVDRFVGVSSGPPASHRVRGGHRGGVVRAPLPAARCAGHGGDAAAHPRGVGCRGTGLDPGPHRGQGGLVSGTRRSVCCWDEPFSWPTCSFSWRVGDTPGFLHVPHDHLGH